ncbi:Crp/Fnr family transcriptional regulator [uncultured Desulfuromonas sp.]|uniref:Crp/Fnr family transcriptional regulator n=1 Tax=uncultured Desulfuromonas sp. TaxID=181013 RepID=UPI00263899EF|nr:Crp/Fnr family transcriptional regulator [uncultured Desulfuromonas sp.]
MRFKPALSTASLAEKLDAFPFFAELSPQGREELLQAASPMHFPAGTQLLEEGGACQALLLVERGGIRVHKNFQNGRGITLYMVHPGESCLLGTTCMLGETRYPAQASVDETTDAIAVPAATFQRMFHQENGLRQFVVGLFSHRLLHLMLLVQDVASRKMDERLAGFLLQQAGGSPDLFYPVTMSHDQIATHLGTAREVVSRLLHQFAREGLVDLRRRQVIIKNPEGLQNRCEETDFEEKTSVL